MWLANIPLLFSALSLLLFHVGLTAGRPVSENGALAVSPRVVTQMSDPSVSGELPQEGLGQKAFRPAGNTEAASRESTGGFMWRPLGILRIRGALIEETENRYSHPSWTLFGTEEEERWGLYCFLGQSSIDSTKRRWYCIELSRDHSSGSMLSKLERRENLEIKKPRTKRQKIIGAIVLTIVLFLSCGWLVVCLIITIVMIIMEGCKQCLKACSHGQWRARFRRADGEIVENPGLNEWGRKVKEVSRMDNAVVRVPKVLSFEEFRKK